MFRAFGACLVTLALADQDPPLLRVDASVIGKFRADDELVADPFGTGEDPLRGDWHTVTLDEPGRYFFELRSLAPGARLLLFAPHDGRILTEERQADQGVRILVEVDQGGAVYRAFAGVAPGVEGLYTLRLFRSSAVLQEATVRPSGVHIRLYAVQGYEQDPETVERWIGYFRDTVQSLDDMGAADALRARVRLHLAGVLTNHRYLDEAQVVLEEASRLSENVEKELMHIRLSSLWGLAGVHRDRGRPEIARELLEECLSLCDEYELGAFERFEVLYQLDYVLQELGDDEEAFAVQEEACRLGNGLLEDPDIAPPLAAVLIHLGNSYAQLGRQRESSEAFARAEELLVEMGFGEEHPLWEELLSLRADGLRTEGRFAEAAELHEQMLERRTELLGDDHPLTASALWWLGFTRAGGGEYEVAAEHMQRARRVGEAWWGNEHPETWSARYFEACYRAALGDADAAAELAEKNLLAAGRRVRLILDGLAERERLAYLIQQRGSLDLLLSLDRREDGGGGDRHYHHVANWKGSVSRELARQKAALVDPSGGRVDQRIVELRSLQSRISAIALGTTDPTEDLGALRRRRDALERELFGAFDPGESGADAAWSLPEVPEDSALVDFLIYRRLRFSDAGAAALADEGLHLSAWVVSAGAERVERVDLGSVERLERLVLEYLGALAEAGLQRKGEPLVGPPPVAGASVERSAAALRAALWTPLEPLLTRARTVYLSPDGFLGRMPFEVIRDERGRYLVEDRRFAYLSDASGLGGVLTPGTGTASLLLIGNVDYGAATGGGALGLGPWDELPGTLAEIEGIAALHRSRFEDGVERSLLQRAQPTEERLREEMPRHAVVHVATHGFHVSGAAGSMPGPGSFRGAAPQNPPPSDVDLARGLPGVLSGIVCAPPGDEDGRRGRGDGLLTAEEMAWMDLADVDLVVLSACSSGVGTPRLGEGMLGLRRAFLQAGGRTVISALWAVPDEETSELMRSFYSRLWVDGDSKLDALRGAQLEMLASFRASGDPTGRPGAWGAFVLEGAIR